MLTSPVQLASDEKHAGQYRLLELFAFGTWGEYLGALPGSSSVRTVFIVPC
jgi:hypothetical protein